MAELKRLVAKRGACAARITEVFKSALAATSQGGEETIGLFKVRYGDLQSAFEHFSEYHNDIIGLTEQDEDFLAQDKIRKECESYYYQSKMYYNKVCKPLDDEQAVQQAAKIAAATSPHNPSTSQRSESLPQLHVPKFNGDLNFWPTFFDMYNQIVHNNTTISSASKLKYLLSYLEGEPQRLLSGFKITDANYILAYNKLERRYQNKRFLATNAMNSIMGVTCKGDSPKELRNLLNTFFESLETLKSLSFNVDSWCFVLFHLLLEKTPMDIRTSFEIQYSSEEIPTYNQLYEFLENRCKALESVQHLSAPKINKVPFSNPKNSNFSKSSNISKTSTFSLQTNSSKIQCYLCKDSHVLSKCPKFLEKSMIERNNFVKNNKLCSNCLYHGHATQACSSRFRCRVSGCNGKHHSSLHIFKNSETASTSSSTQETAVIPPITQQQESHCNTACLAIHSKIPSQVTSLLATAVVDIYDNQGYSHPVRIMIDSGSTDCFISEKCLRRLNLIRRPYSTTICGLNQMSSFSSKGITTCEIKAQNISGPTFSFDAIVVPKLSSNLPFFDIPKGQWEHLKNLHLADKEYFVSRAIDLLVGVEIFGKIIREGRVAGNKGEPTAIETAFGWVLLGKIEIPNSSKISNMSSSNFLSTPEVPLEVIVPKFWEIEKIPDKLFSSPEDIKAEEIFKKTVSRDSTGRFTVSLPFRNGEPNLGDTYTQAFRRFSMLERRLLKNQELYTAYRKFMQEYLDSGHMTLVPSNAPKPPLSCYLPHHCVLKPDSVSTKLRVVWDGSAKGQKGISLNSTLLPGPKLQKDIVSLLLIFRLHPVVFITDIVGMFRQILVTPEHRHFQKILWRFSSDEPLSEWTLNTVTFGISSSPFLAMRVLNELAELEKIRFPLASKMIMSQTFVDDILGTSRSVAEALSLQRELIDLLKLGGFELRKWASNCPELLAQVPSSDRQMPLSFDKEEPHFLKVLGLQWHPFHDCFSYQSSPSVSNRFTKRSVLSDLSKLFDPLGLLCPVILSAKYIMQQIWKAQIDWDTPLPPPLSNSWMQLKSEFSKLSEISLPRRVLIDKYTRCELHGFSDSSEIGYGAVVFLRVETINSISVSLLCAKSRVAPLKTVSLPKLELTAAYLLSDLISFVKETYSNDLIFDEVCAWTDSQVVLAWLKGSPCQWKTFVANRVSHIQDIVPYSSWRYIPSGLNPADAASRGLTPTNLLRHDLWWQGPPFLSLAKEEWLDKSFSCEPDESESEIISSEEKRVVLNVIVETHIFDNLLNKYSKLLTIQKIISYCIRVFTNFQVRHIPDQCYFGYPNVDELQKALMCLIKHVQTTVFYEILITIQQNKLLPKPFRKLSIFLDSDGFLRAGGRLRNAADLPFSVKHPLLLPGSHRLTTLIIEQFHSKYLHPGFKTLHNLLMQQFWILSARKAIQKTLSGCVRCFRARPKSYTPPVMAALPSYRVSQISAFSHVAIDFCGPFLITPLRGRGVTKKFKSYVCIFVCTSTTAIHLELAVDLTTESFIACFRRFVSRRGTVIFCQSDNGTNFVGAYNQLLELAKQASEKLSLKWNFSPPTGPHFNGLAEAGVKGFKTHLVRVVGDQIFCYDEMHTLICEIEAVLNSRPLYSQSSDPNDLIPLTPSHFVTLKPLVPVIPEPDLSLIKINRLDRWQLIQKLLNDFWKRYSTEYLNTLQQRTKWINPVIEVKQNDLVLIKSETTSPLKWPLGRVTEIFPGDDGHVRVVTVKTASGQFRRPVVKLCPLPTRDVDQQ